MSHEEVLVMDLYNLFSVPVLRYSADETYDSIQCEVQEAIKKIKETDDKSCKSFNNMEESYGVERNYNFLEIYECNLLKKRIEESCLSYLHYSRWRGVYDKSKSPIKIDNSWINFGNRDEYKVQHVHPGHKISGVYYFKVSREQGSIVFQNPNPISNTCEFPSGNIFPFQTQVLPYCGDIILFPSWLSHGTVKSKSDVERISIAFNIDLINLNTKMINGLMKGSHIQVTTTEVSIQNEMKEHGL